MPLLADLYNKAYASHAIYERKKRLGKTSKARLDLHPEWVPLTAKEKKYAIYKEDIYELTAFKNTYCKGGPLPYGFVTDIVYQNLLLPKLHKVDYRLNKDPRTTLFRDKNYFDIFLKHFKMPETVLRNVDGEFLTADYKLCKDPMSVLNEYDELVFKGSMFSGQGRGVNRVKKDDYKKMMQQYKEDYIVQKIINQAPSLSKWNESSVNGVRILTLFWKGEIQILSNSFKVGVPGAFCNHTGNSKLVGINDDGTLMNRVLDHRTLDETPDVWGIEAAGQVIEKYDEMKRLAILEHERYPHHRILGWDLTVDENGEVICLEFNADVPGVNLCEHLHGPFFAQRTKRGNTLFDEILHS